MKRTAKKFTRKVSKLRSYKRRNPDVLGTRRDAEAFQDVYHYLTRISDPGEGTFDHYSEMEALGYALIILSSSNSQNLQLQHYEQEITTPAVKKAIKELAKVLLNSVKEVANEYGINPYTGEVIE